MMCKKESYRILVFDDHQEILDLLETVFSSRGYEVLTYPHPGACPIFDRQSCTCPDNQSCTDIILTDINMPFMKGIDFIEMQMAKGCNCKHLALMSGDFTSEDEQKARDMGLKFFKKPFAIAEVFDWLDQIEQKINPWRRLTECKNFYN